MNRITNLTAMPPAAVAPSTGGNGSSPQVLVAAAGRPFIVLPSHEVSITDCARQVFGLLAPTHAFFTRGNLVVELVQRADGNLILDAVKPSAFRSRVEAVGSVFAWRTGKRGEPVLKPAQCPEETAKALLDSLPARELLPVIAGVVACPVLRPDGTVAGKGYDTQTRLLITCGAMPEDWLAWQDAVPPLLDLLADFDFLTPFDRARAVAMMISPALKMAGLLKGRVPADVAEADQSQSGKTYRQRVTAALYGETPTLITKRDGGVGSLDESFDSALVQGRPFIGLDNVRGKFDSQRVEAFLTCDGLFNARVPYAGQVAVDSTRFFVQLSSNGVNTTPDFANRSCFVRIRKRPTTHTWREYSEGRGALLEHVRANVPKYLGAIFSIIRQWQSLGCPSTNETRHDFREWCGVCDWLTRNLFNIGPLMDGHQEAQIRVANPALGFVRQLALAVEEQQRLNEWFIASKFLELASEAGFEIPGLPTAASEDEAKRHVGRLLKRAFGSSEVLGVDNYQIERRSEEHQRDDGRGTYATKSYCVTIGGANRELL